MQLNDRNQMAKIWNLVSLAGLLICVALAFWAYKNGILDSVDTLQAFIAKFGYGGMAIFVLIQIVQVVIPILPGGISCLGGVIFFGPWLGFVYNYIGSRNNSSKMSMIVINDLWLMAIQNTYTTKKEEIEEILSKIKQLVEQEKITVLALVLLSKYAPNNYSLRKELESYENFIRWVDLIVKSSSEI